MPACPNCDKSPPPMGCRTSPTLGTWVHWSGACARAATPACACDLCIYEVYVYPLGSKIVVFIHLLQYHMTIILLACIVSHYKKEKDDQMQ